MVEKLDWDDVRFFLAAARAGSLSVAAKTLGVSVATVGRRVERLEQVMGVPLLHRGVHGVSLSVEGNAMLERAEGVAESMHDLWRASRLQLAGEEISGLVTVSMVDSVVHMLIDEQIGVFLASHPGLELTLRGEPHKAQLATLEADIVVRASRPQEHDAVAKRVLKLGYGVYAHPEYVERCRHTQPEGRPLVHQIISYVPRFARSPEMLWLRERYATHRWGLKLKTMVEIAAAIRAGVGIGLIPDVLATPELVCLARAADLPPREIWIATHHDLQHVPRVRAVMDFLSARLEALGERG